MKAHKGESLAELNIEQIPGIVCVWRYENAAAALIAANQDYQEFFGLGEEASFFPGLPPLEQQRLYTRLSRLAQGERLDNYSSRAVRSDGRSCWVHLSARRVADCSDCPTFLGIFTDITEYMLREKQMDDGAAEQERIKKELHLLYDAYQDGVARVRRGDDGTLKLLFANKAFYRLIGSGEKQFQDACQNILNGLDAETGGLQKQVLSGKEKFRWRYRREDQSAHWAEVRLSPTEQGGTDQAFLTLTDADGMAAADQKQAEREQILAMLDRFTAGGILVRRADKSLDLIYISSNIPLILGYTQEELSALLRTGFWNLLHPEDGKRLLAHRKTARLPLAEYTTEYRVRKKDGTYLWVRDNTRLDDYGDGAPVYFSILIDVSQSRETEQRLRIMEEEYRLAVAHSGKMVYRFNLETRHATITKEAAELFGLKTEVDNVPESVIESGSVAPESVEEYRKFYQSILSGKPSGHTNVLRRVRDGSYRWFLGQFTTVFSTDGAAVSAVGTFEDISEQREKDDLLQTLRRERELLRAVAVHSGRSVFKYDIEAHTAYLDEPIATRFGLGEVIPDMSERTLRLDQVAKESREDYLGFFRAIESGEPSGSALVRRKDFAGEYAWYQADFTTVFEQQRPLYAIISFGDVSDRYEMELAYREYQERFLTLDVHSYACYSFNLTRNRCDQEKGALLEHVRERSDGTLEGVVQYASEFYISEESEAEFRKFNNRIRLLQSYENNTREEQLELLIRSRDETRWILERVQMFEDPYSRDVRSVLSFTDIDKDKRNLLSLLKRADFDSLTGLLNRAAFSERVERVINREEKNHALLLMDLDQFKEFNDSFGHVQGDRLLAATGKLLSAMLRPTDLLGRLGGDEFLIFLINIPDAGLAMRRAEAFCRAIREKLSQQGVSMTASVGVSLCPEDGHSFQELYAQADKSLYVVKGRGGNGSFRETRDDEKQLLAARKEMAGRVFIRAFGHFDVFVDNEPLSFSSAKAKELLAILVDRRGGMLTSDEAIGLLWEDEPSSKVTLARYRKIALRLKNALDEAGIGDILISRRDGRCVDVNCFQCDYYRYLEGDEAARAMYRGSYMSNYSWAESTLAYLEFDTDK